MRCLEYVKSVALHSRAFDSVIVVLGAVWDQEHTCSYRIDRRLVYSNAIDLALGNIGKQYSSRL